LRFAQISASQATPLVILHRNHRHIGDPRVQEIVGESDSIPLTSDPSRQAPPLAIRCSRTVMHRRRSLIAVFRYRPYEHSRPG